MQLASFFPTVCHLAEWELEATVKYKNREMLLNLDQTSKLVGHYTHYGSYVPEEIELFQKDFESKVHEWTITEDTPFLDTDNQELIFPDFTFQNSTNTIIHLELFHRWHATQLLARLKWGKANPDLPLVIGVDRFLSRKPEIKDKLEKSEWFRKYGFLFNGFPVVEKVHKCLKIFAD